MGRKNQDISQGEGDQAKLEALRVKVEAAGMDVLDMNLPELLQGPIGLAGLHLCLPNGSRYVVTVSEATTDQKCYILRDTLECIEKGDQRPRRYTLQRGSIQAWFKP